MFTVTSTENPSVCSGVTFTDHGQQTKSPGYYRSIDSSDEASCQPLCEDDYLCRAFRFQDNKCDLSASDTSWQNLAYDECQTRCANDVTCNGFTYRSDIQRCILTNTKVSLKTSYCEFCSHYQKTCPSGRFFVWAFSSHSRIFHAYGDVTFAGDMLQVSTHAWHSWPLSSEGSLACHTYCNTDHPFIMVTSEDP